MNKIKNMQQSRLVKVLSSYLAFVFIILQVVDIISEPFSFSENLIVYLVYFFGFIFVLVVVFTIQLDRKEIKLGSKNRTFTGNKVLPISLSVIALLFILNIYQFINSKEVSNTQKIVNFGKIIINSKPEGAIINLATIDESGEIISNYKKIGLTPLNQDIETGNYLLKVEKNKWYPLVYNIEILPNIANELQAILIDKEFYDNMAFIPSGRSIIDTTVIIKDFYIDKMEVSNDKFLQFIINGGYENKDYWPTKMNIKGESLLRNEALGFFVDKSGNPGPRGWSGSMYPTGEGQKPVTGITWYEANAYSQFVGKRLPAFDEWWRAALGNPDINTQEKLIRQINFGHLESGALNQVGDNFASLSEFGAYNMAGNVREWTSTYIDNKIIYVGGSWKDPEYIFDPNWRDSYPPFLSDDVIGFRCAY